MRVLHILESTIGGTRRHLRDLVLGEHERGIDCEVLYALGRDPTFACDVELFESRGISCRRFPFERPSRAADIIHAHSSWAGFYARTILRATFKAPIVYTPHCFAFLSDRPLSGVYRAAEKALVRRTDALVVMSRAEYDAALALGFAAENVSFIPNGIAARAEKSAASRKGIIFAGRLCRQKGSDILPRLGVEKIISGAPHAEVLAALETAAGIVVPSRWEGCPYIILEAAQAECPIIAADISGINDLLRDELDALLVPPRNLETWRGAIARLRGDSELCRRLSRSARERLSAPPYTLEAMITSTVALYGNLLSAAHQSRSPIDKIGGKSYNAPHERKDL